MYDYYFELLQLLDLIFKGIDFLFYKLLFSLPWVYILGSNLWLEQVGSTVTELFSVPWFYKVLTCLVFVDLLLKQIYTLLTFIVINLETYITILCYWYDTLKYKHIIFAQFIILQKYQLILWFFKTGRPSAKSSLGLGLGSYLNCLNRTKTELYCVIWSSVLVLF